MGPQAGMGSSTVIRPRNFSGYPSPLSTSLEDQTERFMALLLDSLVNLCIYTLAQSALLGPSPCVH